MKKLSFLIVICFNLITNLQSQELIFTERFENDAEWTCTSEYDSEFDDSAYCGILDNQLILYAHQGGGCARAKAFSDFTSSVEIDLENYLLVFYIAKFEPHTPLAENYLQTNILGHNVLISLSTDYYSEAFTFSIEKTTSTTVLLDTVKLEQQPWNDYVPFGFAERESDYPNSNWFEFSVSGCEADFGHGALLEMDSIQLFNIEAMNTPKAKENLISDVNLYMNKGDYYLKFNNCNTNNHTVLIHSTSGSLLEKLTSTDDLVKIDLSTYPQGIYLLNILSESKTTNFKLINF